MYIEKKEDIGQTHTTHAPTPTYQLPRIRANHTNWFQSYFRHTLSVTISVSWSVGVTIFSCHSWQKSFKSNRYTFKFLKRSSLNEKISRKWILRRPLSLNSLNFIFSMMSIKFLPFVNRGCTRFCKMRDISNVIQGIPKLRTSLSY